MAKQHDYTCLIEWTGDRGDGTRTYRGCRKGRPRTHHG